MKKKEIYVNDRNWKKIEESTGVLAKLKSKVALHSFTDFFVAYFGAWKDFKPTEGMKMKVFIHCILVSERSNPETGSDGNVFKVQRVVKSVTKEMPEVSDTAVRMHISRLAKDGFVIPTDIRGEYYINPKYGIKGTITEKTFLELTVVKNPKDRVSPNEDFEKGGVNNV